MDEAALIRQAQRGDATAYNSLVLHYQDSVYSVAYRLVGESSTAADIVQEAFISAYKAIDRFRGGNFRAWLLRITTNAAYDELRRRKRHPQSSLDEIQEQNESSAVLLNPDTLGPEELHYRRELMRAIERCLEELPAEQKAAAILSDIEGYDYQAIAEVMNISLGTVKSRLSRARAKLRDCLQTTRELLPTEYRLE
ncbi:MAG: sigma-70 family RNA polymerase sigma factor [Candidatus Promineifilaceae bacterium]